MVLTRHDLADTGFAKARKRAEARLTSTVLDLQREIPNIRAFALRRWHDAEQALREQPDDTTPIAAERVAFWDWGLLELLLTSGLRIEEPCELTTFDVLRRVLPDGRLYYLLHIKPSKFLAWIVATSMRSVPCPGRLTCCRRCVTPARSTPTPSAAGCAGSPSGPAPGTPTALR